MFVLSVEDHQIQPHSSVCVIKVQRHHILTDTQLY